MKREDLKALGLSDEHIDAVMGLHGKDIEAHKGKVTDLQAQFDNANAQLTEANKQIESFKNLKPEELQKAAADWETKFKEAEKNAADALAQVKFDHALESALAGAKAKNVKAVQALLSTKDMKLTDDGKILGLDDQLKAIKEQNDYLFEGAKQDPKLVLGANNQPIGNMSALEMAARKGGGFKTGE